LKNARESRFQRFGVDFELLTIAALARLLQLPLPPVISPCPFEKPRN